MKKIVALGMLGLLLGITPVQANEFNINSQEEVVCYGLIPNPFKVATKVITAPAKAAKKKLDTARKVVKMGKKASKIGESDDNDNKDGDIGDRADVVEKNKKKDNKQYEEWKKTREAELDKIAREKEEREKLKRELGMATETENIAEKPVESSSDTEGKDNIKPEAKEAQNGSEGPQKADNSKVSESKQWEEVKEMKPDGNAGQMEAKPSQEIESAEEKKA